MSDEHIFRVIVRGRFVGLGEATRAFLSATQEDHDVSRAEFTREGTLTFDSRIDFFSFRYEVRADGDRAQEVAAQVALHEVEEFMNTMRFDFRDLNVTVSDMAQVWSTRPAG